MLPLSVDNIISSSSPTIKEEEIFFHGEILKPDGSIVHKDVWSGSISDSKMIGESAGQILKEKGGKNFFG